MVWINLLNWILKSEIRINDTRPNTRRSSFFWFQFGKSNFQVSLFIEQIIFFLAIQLILGLYISVCFEGYLDNYVINWRTTKINKRRPKYDSSKRTVKCGKQDIMFRFRVNLKFRFTMIRVCCSVYDIMTDHWRPTIDYFTYLGGFMLHPFCVFSSIVIICTINMTP